MKDEKDKVPLAVKSAPEEGAILNHRENIPNHKIPRKIGESEVAARPYRALQRSPAPAQVVLRFA